MPIEMTRNRLKNLAIYEGEITIEGEHQNEIVIRIPFGEYNEGAPEAEGAYNALYDIEDDRCQECGRYTPESLKAGLCWHCRGGESPPHTPAEDDTLSGLCERAAKQEVGA